MGVAASKFDSLTLSDKEDHDHQGNRPTTHDHPDHLTHDHTDDHTTHDHTDHPPHDTMASQPSEPFECGVCADDKPATEAIEIAGDQVCKDCFDESVKPLFDAAVEHEHSYPVAWGSEKLDPANFKDFLPTELVEKWEKKVKEYETPGKERIYCKHQEDGKACETFIGRMSATSSKSFTIIYCGDCGGSACGSCGAISPNRTSHVCTFPSADGNDDPFEEMQRGKDYQLCPSCSTPVSLRDGCNHLKCNHPSCGQFFCYICGDKTARIELEHFKRGGCPKYNQPGAANAHHDEGQIMQDDEWLLMFPPFLRDEELRRIETAMEPLHNSLHVIVNPQPRDMDNMPARKLRLLHALFRAMRLQYEDTALQDTIARTEQEQRTYHRRADEVEASAQRLAEVGAELEPSLQDALDFFFSRHAPLVQRVEAHLDQLWEQRLIDLPLYLDRKLWRSLEKREPFVQQAYNVADAKVREASAQQELIRGDALQALLVSISSNIIMVLKFLHELPAIRDVELLRRKKEDVAAAILEVVRDNGKIEFKHGGWNTNLRLRVAVATFWNQADGFEGRVEERIVALELD
jgi:hypothetical protein